MRAKTLILTKADVKKLVDMKKAIRVIEEAFKLYGQSKAQMPAKIYLYLPKYNGDFRAMPAYIQKMEACALKWVNVHPSNKLKKLPTVMATIILSDPKTGFPLSIMDGTYLTNLRTGAAGGVAAKYLARKNSTSVGLVGCGAQAKTQLLALLSLFPIKQVRVWGYRKVDINNFLKSMKKTPCSFKVTKTVKECVQKSDIVVTTTPSRKPLVKLRWLKKGAHINAIGADAKGKQELEVSILKESKLVVDDWIQASHSGEVNVAVRKKIISRKDLDGELPKIVNSRQKGRTRKDNITVFDSTGLAIQDAALAQLTYLSAKKKGVGRWVRLIG